MTTIQKKTDRYSFRQLITEVINWKTTDIHIQDNLSKPNGDRTSFNYKIYNDNSFELIGITETRYDIINTLVTHTIHLPFNISYISELSISLYENGVGVGGINYAIFYNNNINSILIVISTPYTDFWDGYVWKICGKI